MIISTTIASRAELNLDMRGNDWVKNPLNYVVFLGPSYSCDSQKTQNTINSLSSTQRWSITVYITYKVQGTASAISGLVRFFSLNLVI